MKKVKSFELELKDLYTGDDWVLVTVSYEDGKIVGISDEWGLSHSLKFLTAHDQDLVEKTLIHELAADLQESESYISDWQALRKFGT